MNKWIMFFLLLLCSACTQDTNRTFVQGIWVGVEDAESSSGQGFIQWQFSRGTFILQQEGRGDNLMVSSGNYDVLESEGNVMMLELYNITGDVFTYNNLPVIYKIEIDDNAGNIRINSRVYERIE